MSWKRVFLLGILFVFALFFSRQAHSAGFDFEVELEIIAEAHGVPVPLFLAIAKCESGLSAAALNPKDTNGRRSVGIFQFQDRTYRAYGGTDIWNPIEQAHIAAMMMKKGGYHHWRNCHAKAQALAFVI